MRTQCLTVCQIGKRGGGGELRGCKVRFVHSLGDVPCFCERAGAVFFWETFRTGGPMQIGRTEQVRFSTVSNNKKSPASDFSHPPPKFVKNPRMHFKQYPIPFAQESRSRRNFSRNEKNSRSKMDTWLFTRDRPLLSSLFTSKEIDSLQQR